MKTIRAFFIFLYYTVQLSGHDRHGRFIPGFVNRMGKKVIFSPNLRYRLLSSQQQCIMDQGYHRPKTTFVKNI